MLKKIRSLAYQHAIAAAFIIFVLIDLLLFGLSGLLSLLPETLPMKYLVEIILMLVPAAFVVFFGFSRAFKKGSFLRGLLCCLPFIILQLLVLGFFFSKNLGDPEANWKPWYLIVYGVFSVFGVGVREECIYRATIQNIVAKKHANSVKGIWITVIVSAIIFGLTHASNLFFGMNPLAVLTQVFSATFIGLMFGAVYLRSGSIWALIFVHTLTDIGGLASSTFLHVSEIEDFNQLSWSPRRLVLWLIYVGLTIFLLRPSKCKQICESLCWEGEESKAATRE
jgi:membrane protease YdiL (CAAX protease family)